MSTKPWNPKPPEFELFALVKGTKIQGKLGSGWLSDDGKSIHIKFEAFVDLNAVRDYGMDAVVTLFDRRP